MQFHSSDFMDKVHVPAVVRGSVCLQIIRCNVNCLTSREHFTINMTVVAKKSMLPGLIASTYKKGHIVLVFHT